MRSPLHHVCASVMVLVSGSAVFAQSPSDRFKERLDPFLKQVVQEQSLPGLAIGIVERGRLVYARGFGTMKWGEPNKPVTPETLFHMASITKTFVATAVMQLAEEGKLELDAPVTQYVPYFRLRDPLYRSITVRQMLTHTSGLPDVEDYRWDKPEYDDGALERYIRSLTNQALLWAPGSKFAYSNMAYEVLGGLVAKVSGDSFEKYVEGHILQPLRMSSSTLLLKEADPAKLATGHTRSMLGAVRVIAFYPYNRAHTPSSNLHSNVLDMARWAIANLNRGELDGQRILKSSTCDVMWKPAAQRNERTSVGLSWFLTEIHGQKAVFHNGGDDGFLTRLVLFPQRQLGVVYMTNFDRANLKAMDDSALRISLGLDVKAEVRKIQ